MTCPRCARMVERLADCLAATHHAARYNVSVFNLRTYRPADFTRLLEIDHACFIEGIAYSEEEMRSFLTIPSAIALVAEQGRAGIIQGFIVADRYRQRRSSHCLGRIITIYEFLTKP